MMAELTLFKDMSQLVSIPRCLTVLQLLRSTAGLICVAVTAGVVAFAS